MRFKLQVGGLVENPIEISYEDLRAMPKTEQVTQHYCIQGWSGIAKWGGVRIAELMKLVRPEPRCRYVVFYSFAHGAGAHEGLYYDVHKIEHMAHENSILAYEMNGRPPSRAARRAVAAPERARAGLQAGEVDTGPRVRESFAELGSGEGGFNEDNEYFGWRAPI